MRSTERSLYVRVLCVYFCLIQNQKIPNKHKLNHFAIRTQKPLYRTQKNSTYYTMHPGTRIFSKGLKKYQVLARNYGNTFNSLIWKMSSSGTTNTFIRLQKHILLSRVKNTLKML